MMGRVVLALCLFTSPVLACPPRHRVGGDDATGAAIAFLLMGFCVIAYTITRANAVRRTFATSRHLLDVHLDTMKHVARAQRSRAVVFGIACGLVINAIAWLPVQVDTKVWLAATPAMLLIAAAVATCQLTLLVWLSAEPGLRVASHGDYLFVSRGSRLIGWVAAPPRLLARAGSLPVAKVRS
jgi:hypothetical protein